MQSTMLAAERHDLILEQIDRHGTVRVRDLTARFGVSEMTVRRDLEKLDERGLLVRVHGGAARPSTSSSFEPGFDVKQHLAAAEKEAIADAAVALVRANTAIGITAGTTTYRLAQRLVRFGEPITVVTNSPSIAQVLYADEQITTVLTGGTRTRSDALVGPLTTASLEALHVDVLFMGVHGIDPQLGFTTPNLAEAEVNRAFVANASQVVVLADHSKWVAHGLARIAPLAAADLLITDCVPSEAASSLTDADVDVRAVGCHPGDADEGGDAACYAHLTNERGY